MLKVIGADFIPSERIVIGLGGRASIRSGTFKSHTGYMFRIEIFIGVYASAVIKFIHGG
jgi:hypothetical protein